MPEQQKVAQDYVMSDFSPILVLQIKICIKPDRHGKCSNKIWETLSFWRDFFNNGAIWLQALICNRLNPRYDMQAVWLSIQRKLARTDARTCKDGCTYLRERLLVLAWRMQCTARTDAVHCGGGCSALRLRWVKLATESSINTIKQSIFRQLELPN